MFGLELNNTEKGVSPVIGVILMVAITVILAAVIGTFVLNLGGSVSETPQAPLTFDQDGTDVTVKMLNTGNVDSVKVMYDDNDDGSQTLQGSALSSAGATVTVDTSGGSGPITALGVIDGEETVMQEYEP